MEQITIEQEQKKEDNALRALISLGSALLEYPLVPELIGVDSQTLLYLHQLQTNLILEYDFITKEGDARTLPSYPLRNNIILNSRTTIHAINNRSRFVNELRLSNDFIYAGTGLDLIKDFRTTKIIIQTLDGTRRIQFKNIAYIPNFYISLVYFQKFNKYGVFQDNKNNLLYYSDRQMYAYCGQYSNQLTLKYHELKLRALKEELIKSLRKEVST